ncbi:MAG: ATP-binding protein [Segetibacter sp.]
MTSGNDGSVTFSEILEAFPDGVVWVKPVFKTGTPDKENEVVDFKVQFSNSRANEFVGLNEPLAGKQIIADHLPEVNVSTNVFLQYRQVFETGEPHEFNYFNHNINRHLHVLRKKFKDGVLTVTSDRTEQENEERERNVQTALVQTMLNACLDGVILLKPVYNNEGAIYDFVVLAANAATKKHFGLTPDEVIGRMMSSVVSRYKATGFFDTYTTALKTGQVQRKEMYYEDERIKAWFDLAAAPIDDCVVVTFLNITNAKNSQDSLKKVAAYLQALIDISQIGIFVLTPLYNGAGELTDFRFRFANRTLAAYVGQQPESLVGSAAGKWFPGYKTNGLFNLCSTTFLTGKTHRFDFHYNDDNINVWLDVMAARFGSEVLVTFSDYTKLKQLQQQLEASVKELKGSNDRLKEFAYVASHDLQEPLRKITTFGNLLVHSHAANLGEDGKRLIERMHSATVRMQVLINDLLNYSQINTRTINLQKVDLNKVVQGVIADLDNSIHESNAIIEIEELPVLHADEVQLRQLFQNLFSNAIKFKRPEISPHITITAKHITGQEAGCNVSQDDLPNEFHEIIVSDNGIGFEQQYAKQIFQVFQRLHGRSDYPGTGIGLAIVQKVAENHKGYVYAKSEPGKGASFHVLLPA